MRPRFEALPRITGAEVFDRQLGRTFDLLPTVELAQQTADDLNELIRPHRTYRGLAEALLSYPV